MLYLESHMWDCQVGYTSEGLVGVPVVEALAPVQEGQVDCCRSEFGNLALLHSQTCHLPFLS